MPCKLSDKQVEALFKAVLQSITTKLRAGQSYDPEQYMRELYGLILKKTNDPANAMDYLQHIPRMIISTYNISEEIADYLTDNGVDLNRLDQLRKDFKDIENIKKFVSVQQNTAAEVIKDIVAETNDTIQAAPSDTYSEIEQSDRKTKEDLYKQSWFAYPATALAVVMQEAQDYGGVSMKDNIVDPDPRKQTYFKVVRNINNELSARGLENASKLKMGSLTGIYLRLIHASSLPKEEFYEKDKAYFSTTDQTGTPEEKEQRRQNSDEVHLVFTDKEGNFIYFDQDGNVSTKENGGTLAYTNLRRPRENNFVPGVQDVKDLARKEPESEQQIREQRNLEIEILKSAREFISKNRDEVVLFNVRSGNNGYTTEKFDSPVKINSITLDGGFSPIYHTIDSGLHKSGGVYFKASPYPLPVLIHRPKFEQIPNLAENLADIIFSDDFSNSDKINILKQFAYSKDTSLFFENNALTISQVNSEGKLERFSITAENKQSFIDTLKGQTVNIVGSLLGNNFKNPVNLDGKVQLVDQKYNNFIADNFYTYLQKNAEGKLVTLNAYNVIEPTSAAQKKIFGEVKVEQKEDSPVITETPTDESLEDLKNKLKNTDFSLKKSTMLDNMAAVDQINAAEQWYKNSPLARVAPFQMMFHVVNSDAFAEFTLAGITLYKGANFTDLYHEGFHVFSQMFLTKDQKAKLYNEARKLEGTFKTPDGRTIKFKDALDIQLEEFLAEDFRKYVLSEGKNIIDGRSVRNNIFQKMWNFLKSLFKNMSVKQVLADREATGYIKDLYDNLYIGNVYQYSPSLSNVQFSLLNKGAQALDAKESENKGLNYQDSSVLVQTIDSMISGILGELEYSIGSVFTNPELMAYVYQAVKNRLDKKKATYTEGSKEAQILDFALANWGDYAKVLKGEEENGIIAYHKLRSSYLTFEERFAEADIIERDETDEVKDENPNQEEELLKKSENELKEEFGANVFERKGNESSVFELASNETIYLVKSLPKVDKKGKPELNMLGEPKLVDFNRTWGIIINAVQGAVDKTDMFNRLVATSKQYPELKALVERLGNPMEKTDASTDRPYYHMWTKFFRDMDVYKIPIKEIQIEKSVDQTGKVTGFKVNFRESDPLDVQVERKMVSAFENAAPGRYIDNSSGVNSINLSNVVADFPYSSIFGTGAIINEGKALQFLNAIGIKLTDNPAMRTKLNNNYSAVNYIYKKIEEQSKLGAKGIGLKSLLNRKYDVVGNVRSLFVLEARYSGNYTNNSVANVNGDPEFDLSLNNSITKLFKELNNTKKDYNKVVEQPHLAHLNHLNNPFAKYSIWLKSMFNIPVNYEEFDKSINTRRNESARSGATTPISINVVNLNGVKSLLNQFGKGVVDNTGGIKTAEMDINSKFLMDIHTMLAAGVMELPRHASKSSAYGVSVSSLSTPYNNNARHLYVSTGHFTDSTTGFGMAASLLMQKVAAEMERIAIVKAGGAPNIPGFNEAGVKFTIFDDILSNDLKSRLISKANADNSYAVVNSAEFKTEVTNQISTYLEKLYQENKKTYSELSFMSQDLLKSTRDLIKKDRPTDKDALNDDEVIDVALRSFTANAFIHNTETVSVLYGDLALYNHNKEEFHKRNAAIGSTGRGFSWDMSDQIMINEMLSKSSYAKSLGIETNSFNGQLNTSVFRENEVKSAYYDMYLDKLAESIGNRQEAARILKPYTEMKEGDAQGWITFDAYKVLSLLEGNWSDKQNEIYNKIVNNEPVDAAEVSEYFPPRKYQYAGPLKTDKLHIQAFHKFSLVPMIPSVIKGTNLETVHRNMMKQNIHYGLFQSGSKLATITKDGTADALYDSNTEERTVPVDAQYTPNTIFIQYLKNQVDINSTWKNKTIFSTQLRKLIINDLFKQGIPINNKLGKLVGKYESLLDNLQKLKKEELLKEIGWKEDAAGNLSGNIGNLVKFVRKELTRQDLADHDIEFVDLNPSGTSIKRDLSFSLNAEKIEKLLNAIVVKRLVRQKLNGEQLVQVSGALYEKRGFRKATKEENIKYGTNDLPTYQPGQGKDGATSAAKIKVAIKGDYYKLFALPDVKELAQKEGISRLDALNRLIKDEEWLDKGDHRKMITITGVRIPVQGANSMEFMEVYEFLPEEAGNILIPPAEIVAKSGSDFDIDKLTIFQPNLGAIISRGKDFGTKLKELQKKHPEMDLSRSNVNIILDAAENDFSVYQLTSQEEQVYKLLQTEFGVPTYIKDKGVKGVENQVVETIREILEQPEVFSSLIRPNETDLVKGVADDLSKFDVQGYNPLANKTKAAGEKISPTRVLEPRYNLYKHESNNIGKKTLGIGAVDNSYSSIFKRIGAFLNTEYTFRTSTGKEHTRNVRILMPHNSINKSDKAVISLSDLSTVGNEKISELISQLMNGWVDIEKDAWIFNINGNNTAGPVLLFLLEAGVDFKTAAYFVSQPLVVDYIKSINRMSSPFYEAAGGVNDGKGLNIYNYRKRFLEKATKKQIKGGQKGIYAAILDVANNSELSQKDLFDNIVNKEKTSATAVKALAHFFEIEDMLKGVTGLKLTVNVDTKPSKSFYAAQEKILNVSALSENDIFSPEITRSIQTDTPIRSFFTQAFQIKVWEPLMKMRAGKVINEFLINKIKNRAFSNTSFKDAEKYAAAFKNDLPLYLMQNYLKNIDIDNIKEYNGLFIQKSLPTEAVQLKYGAFVKDGKMFIDAQQIRKDFDTKAYNDKGYELRGLHKVDSSYFNSGDNAQNFKEYSHFVLEREYLRSITPVQANQSREAYEKDIAERALRKTFNWANLLKGPDSIAANFEKIRSENPELANQYMIFDQVQPVKDKIDSRMMTLKLVSERMTPEMVNTLHENLTRLADFGTIKVNDPVKNREISNFFNRMIVGEYLRAGITKSSESLSKILPTDALMRLLEEPMKNFQENGLSEITLEDYSRLFTNNWSVSKAKSRSNRFRNYLDTKVGSSKPAVTEEDGQLKPDFDASVIKDNRGVNVFTSPASISGINKLLSENSNYVFVYPTNTQGVSNHLINTYSKNPNSISIPVIQGGKTAPMTDANYDKNVSVIDQAIKLMEEQVADGNQLAFPKDGVTIMEGAEVLAKNAPRTFGYLTTQLFKKFGYVNPGAERDLGFRKQFQSTQEITDEQVDEFMKKCFGN